MHPLSGKKMHQDNEERRRKLQAKMIKEIQEYAIILLDIDGTILTWNKGAEKIKGYREEEILGQNFNIFYMPQDRERKLPQQLIEIAKREGTARHIGKRVRKDGTTFWGSIVITAIHDDDGQVIGFTKVTKELPPGSEGTTGN